MPSSTPGRAIALLGQALDPRPVDGDERELHGDEERGREDEQDDGQQLQGDGDRSNLPPPARVREPAGRGGGRRSVAWLAWLAVVTVLQVVLGALVMTAGAFLQGAVGFGANLIAAPLLLLVNEDYVPGPLIVASVAHEPVGDAP